jgi:hypothetical protein
LIQDSVNLEALSVKSSHIDRRIEWHGGVNEEFQPRPLEFTEETAIEPEPLRGGLVDRGVIAVLKSLGTLK